MADETNQPSQVPHSNETNSGMANETNQTSQVPPAKKKNTENPKTYNTTDDSNNIIREEERLRCALPPTSNDLIDYERNPVSALLGFAVNSGL